MIVEVTSSYDAVTSWGEDGEAEIEARVSVEPAGLDQYLTLLVEWRHVGETEWQTDDLLGDAGLEDRIEDRAIEKAAELFAAERKQRPEPFDDWKAAREGWRP